LATGEGGPERLDAAGRIGDADQRNGLGASASAVELASSRAGSIKHFRLISLFVKNGPEYEKTLAFFGYFAYSEPAP
jgi:hypothetical protein